MLRTPDVPTSPKKKFSEADFEEEKLWLDRKKQGKIYSSETEGGWTLALGTAALIGFVIGGTIGTMIAFFTHSFLHLAIPFVVVTGISLYFLKGDFATIEVDPERGLILYEGNISLGGELRSTRYRGPYQVIDSTLLVKFSKFKLFKSKPYIRFMTGSGYMRANFDPSGEEDFLRALERLDLLNLSEMEAALDQSPVRKGDGYMVYYEKKFDREQFKADMRRKREAEKRQEKIDKKIKRRRLIEKSKKFSKDVDSKDQVKSEDKPEK